MRALPISILTSVLLGLTSIFNKHSGCCWVSPSLCPPCLVFTVCPTGVYVQFFAGVLFFWAVVQVIPEPSLDQLAGAEEEAPRTGGHEEARMPGVAIADGGEAGGGARLAHRGYAPLVW